MGEDKLVEPQIDDAVTLAKYLDANRVPLTLVAWYWFDDGESWQLLLAGAALDIVAQKPILAYRKVVEAIEALDLKNLSGADVRIVESRSPLAQAIAQVIKTMPGTFTRARCTSTMKNGIFLKEMLVLRSIEPSISDAADIYQQQAG